VLTRLEKNRNQNDRKRNKSGIKIKFSDLRQEGKIDRENLATDNRRI
jgi:hypothetical protein